MLRIKSFTFNPFMENTFVLFDESKEALIIDPGCYEKEETKILTDFILAEALKPVKLINTHCHIDHVLGNAFVKSHFKLPLWMHAFEVPVLKSVSSYASNYGFPAYQDSEPDFFFKDGDTLKFGNTTLEILWVPGHAPGHVVLYDADSLSCICGDTLFQGSIGRTDLPGGNHETLIKAIKEKLLTLPEEVTLYPGHGAETTVGAEKKFNPFVGERARF
ncbi:MBL fold metallo-hydrolase [Pararhodonellum marinum]|uniref:MBL fold metallo-hydrolase n=1 Tax=Pararhodonellum marinum TaxID=2755358 RepID=UPI00188F6EB5|nr:MBL fold metallo-hydrolase [Pararhodonellum marinum]